MRKGWKLINIIPHNLKNISELIKCTHETSIKIIKQAMCNMSVRKYFKIKRPKDDAFSNFLLTVSKCRFIPSINFSKLCNSILWKVMEN